MNDELPDKGTFTFVGGPMNGKTVGIHGLVTRVSMREGDWRYYYEPTPDREYQIVETVYVGEDG
jgi:hypothetical protein